MPKKVVWTKAMRAKASAAGKRGGRARKSVAEKIAAGTYRPDKDRARGIAPPLPVVILPGSVEDRPYADLTPARAEYLRQVIKQIPGYDPHRDAGACTFHPELAHKVLEFFRCRLRHAKGAMARKPFELCPWQEAILANIFGWLRPDGTRRFREAFLYVPKKNGKTALAAGLIVYMLAEDPEEGQENYSAAASRDQASLVFQQASSMIRQSPTLSRDMRVYGAQGGSQLKRIVRDRQGVVSFYAALAADASHADGGNVHLAIPDELHEHPNADMIDILRKGMAARTNPLLFALSTADYDRPESPCNALREYAVMVRDGRIKDPAFLPVIYEAGPKDDWAAEETWRKANPNFGVSVQRDFYAAEAEKCKVDVTKLNNFKRYFLNIITGQSQAWLPMEAWDQCAGEGAADPMAWRKSMLTALAGKPCQAALDLGSSSDLCAFVLRFQMPDDVALVLPWFWMPRDGIRIKSPDHARIYEAWLDQGFVKGTMGNVTDYDVIREDINDLRARFNVLDIAFDPHQATQISTQLTTDGAVVYQYPQAIKYMAEPTKRFRERATSRKLMHGNNPVLRWMASNTFAKTYKNVEVVMKGADRQRKIDGIVAAIMAEGRAMVAKVEGPSVYASRGLRVV